MPSNATVCRGRRLGSMDARAFNPPAIPISPMACALSSSRPTSDAADRDQPSALVHGQIGRNQAPYAAGFRLRNGKLYASHLFAAAIVLDRVVIDPFATGKIGFLNVRIDFNASAEPLMTMRPAQSDRRIYEIERGDRILLDQQNRDAGFDVDLAHDVEKSRRRGTATRPRLACRA